MTSPASNWASGNVNPECARSCRLGYGANHPSGLTASVHNCPCALPNRPDSSPQKRPGVQRPERLRGSVVNRQGGVQFRLSIYGVSVFRESDRVRFLNI